MIIGASNSSYQDLIGGEVLSIDNIPIEDLLNKEIQTIPATQKGYIMAEAVKSVLAKNRDHGSFKVIIRKINKEIVERYFLPELREYHYNLLGSIGKAKKIFEEINESIIYLNLDLMKYDDFTSKLSKIKNAKSIILDMRGYPDIEDDKIEKFIGHFIKNKLETKWMFTPQIQDPTKNSLLNSEKEEGWDIPVSIPHINAKVYFLINHKTLSYGESITGYFAAMPNSILIGSPTAGANGSANIFSLPGSYTYRYTGMKVLKHDGSRLHGIGFLPDVEVRPTVQGIIDGRDEVLEKAIELAKKEL
jgi:C-terminal processing protease CtpA/Prc